MKKLNSDGVANNYPGRQTTPQNQDLRRKRQEFNKNFCEICGREINRHSTRQLLDCEVEKR